MKFGTTMKLRRAWPVGSRYLLGLSCLGVVFFMWWIATRGDIPEERILSPTKLPSIGETFGKIGQLFEEQDLVRHLLLSLKRVVFGFGLAIIIGIPLGLFAASFRVLEAFLAPVAVFGRNVPLGALVPLSLVFFGVGEKQVRMFIFIATVPFVFATTVAAVLAIPERYVETARTLGASRRQVIMKVLLPLSMPDVVTSIRQLFGLAWGYIMLAEVAGIGAGVGWLLNSQQSRGGDAESVYLTLFMITIVAFAIDRLLYWVQRGIFPYRKDL